MVGVSVFGEDDSMKECWQGLLPGVVATASSMLTRGKRDGRGSARPYVPEVPSALLNDELKRLIARYTEMSPDSLADRQVTRSL